VAVKLSEEDYKFFRGNSRLVSYFEKNLEATYRELAVAANEPTVRCLQGQAQFLQNFIDQLKAPPPKPVAQPSNHGF
jgi:hypothetical protein